MNFTRSLSEWYAAAAKWWGRNSLEMFLCFQTDTHFWGEIRYSIPPTKSLGEDHPPWSPVVYAPGFHFPPLEGPQSAGNRRRTRGWGRAQPHSLSFHSLFPSSLLSLLFSFLPSRRGAAAARPTTGGGGGGGAAASPTMEGGGGRPPLNPPLCVCVGLY